MNDIPFKAAPFFLVRTPIWAVEDYEKVLLAPNWIEKVLSIYEEDPIFREAILIASPSLYACLKKKPLQNKKQLAFSLLKYMNRMSHRSIPFGLFACVSVGYFGNQTSCSFDHTTLVKRARIDMEWLFTFINDLYKKNGLLNSSLLVRKNPFIQFAQNRYRLDCLFQAGEVLKKPFVKPSIKANRLIDAIFDFCKIPIALNKLWEELNLAFPHISMEKTEELIFTLIQQQFLLSGHLPSLYREDPIIASKLVELQSIADMIETYHSLPIGQAEQVLSEIQNHMGGASKNVLQIDVAASSPFIISHQVAQEAQEAMALIWKLSSMMNPLLPLKPYHDQFIEKYGLHQTVPLLEYFYTQESLSSLPDETNHYAQPSEFTSVWEKWLQTQWQNSIKTNKKEIILEDTEIDKLIQSCKEKPTPLGQGAISFDLYCKILASSEEDIDQGRFSLFLFQNTTQAGSTFGRFLDLLGKPCKEQLKNFLEEEEKLEPGAKFVELSCWPTLARASNVVIVPNMKNHQIDLFADEQSSCHMSLEDICIGAYPDRFYLTSKEGNEELLFPALHSLNTTYMHPLFYFIYQIMAARNRLLYLFPWNKITEKAQFLPRVRYKKAIFSPARWRLTPERFINLSPSAIKEDFRKWADMWDLPERFFIIKGDQQFLVDQRLEEALDEIYTSLKQGETVEIIEEFHDSYVKSAKGHHLVEMTIPFIKNSIYANKNSPFKPSPYLAIPLHERLKLPGSDWIFVKFYLKEEAMGYFLAVALQSFLPVIKEAPWFFIRYSDPKKHVRLRINAKLENVISFLEKYCQKWIEIGLIEKMTLDTYDREIERYGGLSLIQEAEKIFCSDSCSVLLLLEAIYHKKTQIDSFVLYVMSAIMFLRSFRLSDLEINNLLKGFSQQGEALRGFREHKKALMDLLKKDLAFEETFEIMLFREMQYMRRLAIDIFLEKSTHLSSHARTSILHSLLHMHCNRLGCNREMENRLCSYIPHVLNHFQYINKHQDQKECTMTSLLSQSMQE